MTLLCITWPGLMTLGVVHVPSFFKELETLKAKGVNTENRVLISDRGTLFFYAFTVHDS
jgi:adenylosuccinate synthase